MTHRWAILAVAIIRATDAAGPMGHSDADIDPCTHLCTTIVSDCPDGIVSSCVSGFCESIYISDNRVGYHAGAVVDGRSEPLSCTRASEILVALGFIAPSDEMDSEEQEVPERSHGAMVLLGIVRPPPASTTSTPAPGR